MPGPVVHGPRAFDNEKYLEEQSAAILERVKRFENKLYLEFGGKLIHDQHAARVLPGFDPDVKLRLLKRLKDIAEIIVCIHAGDIERRKVRADFGIPYDSDVLKLIDDLREQDLPIRAVVITRYADQPAAMAFRNQLERRDVRVYTHRAIPNYAVDVERTVSEEGYGSNAFVETTRPLVVVTAPGPNSGKLATCLSQVYHENRRGVRAGYAKFETFPIWSLPLRHPVNVAYEAATSELRDVNLIDPFHLEAYGIPSVNYNRDVEAFPLLRRILKKISGGEDLYKSPTDMGVNRAGFAIIDDAAARHAARQEIVRRFYRYACEHALGQVDAESVRRIEVLMEELEVGPEDRPVVRPAREAAAAAEARPDKGHRGVFVGAALQLATGEMVTGVNSPRMHAASALLMNARKRRTCPSTPRRKPATRASTRAPCPCPPSAPSCWPGPPTARPCGRAWTSRSSPTCWPACGTGRPPPARRTRPPSGPRASTSATASGPRPTRSWPGCWRRRRRPSAPWSASAASARTWSPAPNWT